jgi:hypothetical protein
VLVKMVEKINRSFSLSYTSRRSSNSDTVADINASFDNPESDAVIAERLSTWLSAIFSLPHHAGAPAEPFALVAPPYGERINTNFSLSCNSRREHTSDTVLDLSLSFENPPDRQCIYDRLDVWLAAAGIALRFKTDKADA